MPKVSHEAGEAIAKLINSRDAARLMMNAIHAAPAFDGDADKLWRAEYTNATEALRAMGVPVIA